MFWFLLFVNSLIIDDNGMTMIVNDLDSFFPFIGIAIDTYNKWKPRGEREREKNKEIHYNIIS